MTSNKTWAAARAATCVGLALLLSTPAWAKLPTPVLSDEAKAKAAETAARNAWNAKVADFQLCRSMDAAAANHFAQARLAGKDVKPPVATAACADPGPFVYTPAAPK